MEKSKIILHLDINYFFAQVEEILNPYYKDKPTIVVSHKQHGIVLTSNYIARKYGVKSAQKVFEALKLCPDLQMVESKMEMYQKYSHDFFNCVANFFSDEIEFYSIDEGYIDATPLLEKYHNNIFYLVNEIYQTVLRETGLKISIGIGDTKFLAKTANDISDKKTFYYHCMRDELSDKLYPQPIEKIFFVGKNTAKYFKSKNIKTVNDFLTYKNQIELATALKSKYQMLRDFFLGNSSDELELNHETKSFSLGETFLVSTAEVDTIKQKIIALASQLFIKLREQNSYCKTFVLSFRDDDRKTISRSYSVDKKISDKDEFCSIYIKLLNKYWDNTTINQITVGANKLMNDEWDYSLKQMSLLDDDF